MDGGLLRSVFSAAIKHSGRAVDPDALERVNGIEQFLPALYFAVNLAGDTVSTDFTRAAAQSKES